MTAPQTHAVTLQPPYPGMRDNTSESFKFDYELWKRTGAYKSSTPNLTGLEASVDELNTLVGIETADTVQEQLNQKTDTTALGSMAFQDATNVSISGGFVTNISASNSVIANSDIRIPAGTLSIQLNGTLMSDPNAVGNVGSGEDTLITYTMPAATVDVNGQFIEIEGWGTFAANANNKRLKLKFGGATIFDTTAVAANSGSWWLKAKIIRTAGATQQIISEIISDNALITNATDYVDGTEDFTTALNIFCTGEATSDDDIIQKGLTVKWFNT